jgi:NDP-sugar pyrophosphorylase family protein
MGRGKSLRAIVLAGNFRWEANAFDAILPRPLMPVVNTPLICFALDWLSRGGVTAMTICVNSEAELFRRCLGDGSALGIELDYFEDHVPRGPAGCARDAAQLHPADLHVVMDATVIPRFNLTDLLNEHRRCDGLMTVVADRAAIERDARRTPAGIYVMHTAAFEYIADTGYQDIKESLIPKLHVAGQRVRAYSPRRGCLRVAGLHSYLSTNSIVLSELSRMRPPEGYEVRSGCLIHQTAGIDAGVVLLGPALIGAGTTIERGSVVVGPTAIGSRCAVGAQTVIGRSVVWDDSTVFKGARISRCVVGGGQILHSATTPIESALGEADYGREPVGLKAARVRGQTVVEAFMPS